MAQVVRVPKLEQFVKKDLEDLLAFWRTVPELADEWPNGMTIPVRISASSGPSIGSGYIG